MNRQPVSQERPVHRVYEPSKSPISSHPSFLHISHSVFAIRNFREVSRFMQVSSITQYLPYHSRHIQTKLVFNLHLPSQTILSRTHLKQSIALHNSISRSTHKSHDTTAYTHLEYREKKATMHLSTIFSFLAVVSTLTLAMPTPAATAIDPQEINSRTSKIAQRGNGEICGNQGCMPGPEEINQWMNDWKQAHENGGT